jgi:hypothetical protein
MAKVDLRKYGRQASGGAVRVNLRVRRVPPGPLTRADAEGVFAAIVDTGRVPRGFQLAVMDWQNPKKATPRWVSGNVADLDAFGAVLAMATHGRRGASGLRVAVVKRTDPPAFA